jgi:endonuclease/exonuclease/phosphatase family metal-dependent hydrolase
MLIPLSLAAVVAVGPVMGLCVPWHTMFAPEHDAASFAIRVVTCNVGTAVDRRALAGVCQDAQADLVLLQEWYYDDMFFEKPAHLKYFAQYADLFIASRFPIDSGRPLHSDRIESWRVPALRVDVVTPHGRIHIVNVHLETPREGLESVQYSAWRGADAMDVNTERRQIYSRLATEFPARTDGAVIVAGDFNMTVESRIYARDWSDYVNAFTHCGIGFGHTKFTRWHGVRIDHILVNQAWQVRSAWVAADVGSDHRPVVAELDLNRDAYADVEPVSSSARPEKDSH